MDPVSEHARIRKQQERAIETRCEVSRAVFLDEAAPHDTRGFHEVGDHFPSPNAMPGERKSLTTPNPIANNSELGPAWP